MLAAACGWCVSVFTSVAMSEQCIPSVIFINSYLWMMSADCDGVFKGQKWRLNQGDHRVCTGKKQSGHSVIQHDSGCRLKAGGPTVTITSQRIVCLLMRVCGSVVKLSSRLWKATEVLVLATSRPNSTQPQHSWRHCIAIRWKTSATAHFNSVQLLPFEPWYINLSF